MTEPFPTVEQLKAEFEQTQALFDRKARRMRRIALAFLVPYVAAGLGVGWVLTRVHTFSSMLAGVLLGCFVVIVGGQWMQPYLQRRGDRKDSISKTTGGTDASV